MGQVSRVGQVGQAGKNTRSPSLTYQTCPTTRPASVPAVAAIFAPVPAVLAAVAPVFATVADVLARVAAIFDAIADAAVVPRITAVLAAVAAILGLVTPVFTSIATILAAVPHVLTPVRARPDPIGACLRQERGGRHQRQYQSLQHYSSSHRSLLFRAIQDRPLRRRYQLGRQGRGPRCFAILQ
jgi:hypothetical protein